MRRQILLAVRPDERASATLDTAAWIARELGAGVTLLYVAVELETISQVAGGAGLSEEAAAERIRSEVQRDLEAVARRHLQGVDVGMRIEQGDIVERIITVAEQVGASLIVVGTHGRTAAARLVLGDTADAVLAAARCPVVVVPRGRGAGE